jgi:hypothetical protein
LYCHNVPIYKEFQIIGTRFSDKNANRLAASHKSGGKGVGCAYRVAVNTFVHKDGDTVCVFNCI